MTCYVPRLTISKGVKRKMHSLPARDNATRASMDLLTASWACEQVGWEIEEAIVITAHRDQHVVHAPLTDAILDACERRDGKLAGLTAIN